MKKTKDKPEKRQNALYKLMSVHTLKETVKNGLLFRAIEDLNDCFEAVDIDDSSDQKLISFTRCHSHHLMWAHYGVDYSGCVIMIDRSFYSTKGITFDKVKYARRKERKRAPMNERLLY